MNYEEFLKSVENPAGGVPPKLPAPLEALWHERTGDWDRAHRIVQAQEGAASAWVHAYLHRREGDISNARYWYARAAKPEAAVAPDQEWEALVRELLDDEA
ncbi:MAG: hypothetical protein AB7T14_06215 [Candidatus Methylacidiphilaceae bacterium]